MSKLENLYHTLKKENSEQIYLFKSGIFYIALLEDAVFLSELYNLKISQLAPNVCKCGFPCSSFDKYYLLFQAHNLNVKIIDSNVCYTLQQFKLEQSTADLLNFISKIDTDSLSIREAYALLDDLSQKAKDIKELEA